MTEFRLPVRVYYEDTDAGGVVYHTNYLQFMERARTEWLRSLGFEQDQLMRDPGVIFAVRHMEIDYLQPAKFNDLLTVSAGLASLGKASIVFNQQVQRDADGKALCRARVKVACLDSNSLRPTPIPKQIQEKIQHAD